MVPRPKPGGDSLLCPNLNEDLVALTDPERYLTGSSHQPSKSPSPGQQG